MEPHGEFSRFHKGLEVFLALLSVTVAFLPRENAPTRSSLIAKLCMVFKGSGKILLKAVPQSLLNPCMEAVHEQVHSMLRRCSLSLIHISGCCFVTSISSAFELKVTVLFVLWCFSQKKTASFYFVPRNQYSSMLYFF